MRYLFHTIAGATVLALAADVAVAFWTWETAQRVPVFLHIFGDMSFALKLDALFILLFIGMAYEEYKS